VAALRIARRLSMTDPDRGADTLGRLYWCIKTDLAPQGEIYVLAERLEVLPSGALVAWGGAGAQGAGAMNLACAPGRWSAAFLASPVDGAGIAVRGWLDEGGRGAASAPEEQGLREVPRGSP